MTRTALATVVSEALTSNAISMTRKVTLSANLSAIEDARIADSNRHDVSKAIKYLDSHIEDDFTFCGGDQ